MVRKSLIRIEDAVIPVKMSRSEGFHMSQEEIELKMNEFNSRHPVDVSVMREMDAFLESLSRNERIYAAQYASELAE